MKPIEYGVSFETEDDFDNARILQEEFPKLGLDFSKGLTLVETSQKVSRLIYDPILSLFTPKELEIDVKGALLGGEYNGVTLEGLMSPEKFHRRFVQRRQDYDLWSDEEKDYVLNMYRQGKQPLEIYELHLKRDDFEPRTHNTISSFLDLARINGLIGHHKIDWKGEIGFFALELLIRYGREKGYLVENTKTLNDYFFDGEEKITKSKLSLFYTLEKKKETVNF